MPYIYIYGSIQANMWIRPYALISLSLSADKPDVARVECKSEAISRRMLGNRPSSTWSLVSHSDIRLSDDTIRKMIRRSGFAICHSDELDVADLFVITQPSAGCRSLIFASSVLARSSPIANRTICVSSSQTVSIVSCARARRTRSYSFLSLAFADR